MRPFVFFLIGLFAIVLAACAAPATPAPTTAPTLITIATTVASPIPPTATHTAAPPTATNTSVPPTATQTATTAPTKTFTATAKPTNTATATNTATPTLTPTDIPPTATFTATRKPATRAPTKPAQAFTVKWNTDIGYEGRDATTFWCKFHNQYQNLSAEEFPFQSFGADAQSTRIRLLTFDPKLAQGGYQPVIGIANADGSINRWRLAGWYARLLGWPNGIEPFPPNPLAANSVSDDWTWYSISSQGEFCKYAYVKWKGQTFVAEYAPDGKLISTNAKLPEGAP